MIYLELFWSMFQIGLFSIGGGYAAVPLIQDQIVNLHGWLTATEFTDIITIAEMTPGPIAINSATFVGIRVAGLPGALVATFGCVLPSCVIVLIMAKLYYRYRSMNVLKDILAGLRPAVVGMIASAALSILLLSFFTGGSIPSAIADVNFVSVGIFAAGIFALRKWKPGPIVVIGASGLIGILAYLI